jgi:hypothetical protein
MIYIYFLSFLRGTRNGKTHQERERRDSPIFSIIISNRSHPCCYVPCARLCSLIAACGHWGVNKLEKHKTPLKDSVRQNRTGWIPELILTLLPIVENQDKNTNNQEHTPNSKPSSMPRHCAEFYYIYTL